MTKFSVERLRNRLFEPIAGHSLALFRILFGTIMASEMLIGFVNGKVRYCYVEPAFFFSYLCTPFVTPLPGPLMYAVCALIVVSAIFIAAGFYFRASAIVFSVLYVYVFLIDKTMYNNHYYLICLLSFLLAISSAGKCWSVDNLIRPSGDCRIPRWNLSILRFQIALVLFYGGIAKLNYDWLNGEPMRAWLQERSHYPIFGPYWNTELGVMFFTYGGLLFDLLVPIFLLSGTMFWLIVPVYLFFNLTNSWLFTIGSFPPLMLAALLLFVPPEAPRIWWQYLKTRLRLTHEQHPADYANDDVGWTANRSRQKLVILGLGAYALVQILTPLRHFLYPGDVSWTEEGHPFSWHMKLRHKEGKTEFMVTDAKTGHRVIPDANAGIALHQLKKVTTDPDLIWLYAQHLAQKARSQGATDPIVTVRTSVALNSRPPQDLIKPDVDLSKCRKDIWHHSAWISELRAPPPNVRPGLLTVASWLTAALASACALVQLFGTQSACGKLTISIDTVCFLVIAIVFALTRIFNGADLVLCYGGAVIVGITLSVLRFVEYLARDTSLTGSKALLIRFASVYLVTIFSAVSLVLAYGRTQF